MKDWLLIGCISAALLYGGMAGLLYLNQKQLVFLPRKKMDPTPTGYPLEEVSFTTEDQIRLNGQFLDTSGDITVIFCHGNGANISELEFFMDVFRKLELDALFFDYRGYGKSGGEITAEEDLYRDVAAAYRYLRRKKGLKPSRIVVWGKSLGGAAAIDLALKEELRAVIVQSTFTSLTERVQEMVPLIPVEPLLNFRYDNREKIGNVDSPILITHSVDDNLVPFSHGKALYRTAREPKAFLTLAGPHSRIADECLPGLLKEVRKFIEDPLEGISRREADPGPPRYCATSLPEKGKQTSSWSSIP